MMNTEKRRICDRKKINIRASWEDYNLGDVQYRRKLKEMVRSGKYECEAREAAYESSKDIAEYILLSVKKNKPYEGVEYDRKLGRIPCGRSDFYGYRRLFYHIFDGKVRGNERD